MSDKATVYYHKVTGGTLERALCGLPYDERTSMGMECADDQRGMRFVFKPEP